MIIHLYKQYISVKFQTDILCSFSVILLWRFLENL